LKGAVPLGGVEYCRLGGEKETPRRGKGEGRADTIINLVSKKNLHVDYGAEKMKE